MDLEIKNHQQKSQLKLERHAHRRSVQLDTQLSSPSLFQNSPCFAVNEKVRLSLAGAIVFSPRHQAVNLDEEHRDLQPSKPRLE